SARAAAPGPPPPPPEPVAAALALQPERISVSASGFFVLPVDVVNRGPAVDVVAVRVRAEPVLELPGSSGSTRVGAADRSGVVAIVRPDCDRLQGGEPFTADVRVLLRTADGATAEPAIEIGSRELRRLLALRCGLPPPSRVPPRR
ncbi:MAG TPA: hypothetical protein VM433_06755, partial [Mycobacteriales bacterium]|nr:hypothetical protein [Mycobacteriales bacterium]